MEKRPNFHEYEKEIYRTWEDAGAFTPERDPDKEPYTIVLPPPNASGKMHTGNVLMIAIEDLLVRWKRMQGYAALWVPGTDHAGFETQITFERRLNEEGKSRFDYDRQTLYEKIWDFVQKNKSLIEDQIREMGASVDWTRYKFTLDPDVIETVTETFKKMHAEGLVYRDDYMVNYCPQCGTTFADLEVTHKERTDPLVYVRYPLIDRKDTEPQYVVVATVRPEPIFADTHIAVHPDDPNNNWLIGRQAQNPLTNESMDIIADTFVDPAFGTGVVKLTPAHDPTDYKVAKAHNLPINAALDLDGKLVAAAGEFADLPAKEARKRVIDRLQKNNLIEKIDESYTHSVTVCYKGGHDIEPMVLPNWFIKVDSLKEPAKIIVEDDEVTIYPEWRKITYIRWMEEMHDWPISRQVVWGIRIPAWYNVNDNPDLQITFLNPAKEVITGSISEILQNYSFEEVAAGLQTLIAPQHATFIISTDKPDGQFLQETDTFDTWFSSGHWPLVTLGYPNSEDFTYFYPTSVLETGWEIIRLWVSRMIMFGIYLTGKPPFTDVYLHGLVKAIDGRKMSKSLGNIINPDDYIKEFGVDALRMGLISGTANGKDFSFPHDKIVGYQRFGSKIWNMTRFMLMMKDTYGNPVPAFNSLDKATLTTEDTEILATLQQTITTVQENLEKYRFADAAEAIYQFMWHDIADTYIESVKNRPDKDVALSVLAHVLITSLTVLHPFMPFITEKLYQTLREEGFVSQSDSPLLMLSRWPISPISV